MNNILILDDDFAIRLLYKVELADEGYHVIDTDDCVNILHIIDQHMPDLIILDIMLGQFNGLDILQEIRNKYYDMPIILCSAYATFKYDMKSIAADYYVTKSADLKRLKTVIKMALETKVHNTENLFWEFQERNPLVSDEAELGFT
jgi:DNA-binding response OmpR family regulator